MDKIKEPLKKINEIVESITLNGEGERLTAGGHICIHILNRVNDNQTLESIECSGKLYETYINMLLIELKNTEKARAEVEYIMKKQFNYWMSSFNFKTRAN